MTAFLSKTFQTLDLRSQEIFKQIVENYLQDGDPIGSRNLSQLLSQTISPATIRKVMNDLEVQGLISSPHISAGRVPTQSGLRYFIDSFMQIHELSFEEKKNLKQKIRMNGTDQSLEGFLKNVSQILSDISQSASLIITEKQDLKLKSIEFIRLDQDRAIAILIRQNDEIENRILKIPKEIDSNQLIEASNYLNAHISNRTLKEAIEDINQIKKKTHCDLNELSRKLVEKGIEIFKHQFSSKKKRLFIHGHGNLLNDIKKKEDLKRIKQLFEDFEKQEQIEKLLTLTEEGSGVNIFIGAENELFSFSKSSLIIAPYQDKKQKIIGTIGIIGPTYINYAKLIPIVNYTAQLIGQLIK